MPRRSTSRRIEPKGAEQNPWLIEFKGAADTRKFLDDELAARKVVLTELGRVKQ